MTEIDTPLKKKSEAEVLEELLRQLAHKEYEDQYNPVPETQVVPLMLKAVQTYIERSKIYGAGGFEEHGKLLKALFPDGLTLETEEHFSRFVLFIMQTVKICRYAKHITTGGHKDSVHDNGVYSFILEDYDARVNNRN